MPKEIKKYQCELCGALYDSQQLALECEHVHLHVVSIDRELFAPGGFRGPSIIHVKLGDGSVMAYKLSAGMV